MVVVSRETAICIECLRCQHRGVIERGELAQYGAAPDEPIARLSRRLVCTVCGSKALRAFRAAPADAADFLGSGR